MTTFEAHRSSRVARMGTASGPWERSSLTSSRPARSNELVEVMGISNFRVGRGVATGADAEAR